MMVAFEWDPQDPNTVYGGTDGGKLYRSGDRGVTWEALPVAVGTVAVGRAGGDQRIVRRLTRAVLSSARYSRTTLEPEVRSCRRVATNGWP